MYRNLGIYVKYLVGMRAYYPRENVYVVVQSVLVDVSKESTDISFLCVEDGAEEPKTFYIDENELIDSKA